MNKAELLRLAGAALAAGDRRRARDCCRAAAAADPVAPEPHRLLGLIATQENDWPTAYAHFAQGVGVAPRDSHGRINLAQAAALLGRPDEALEQTRIALALEPDSAPALLIHGSTLQNQGRIALSLPPLRAAAVAAPRDGAILTVLGNSLLRAGDQELAVRHYERVLTLDPVSADALGNLAAAQYQIGRLDLATHLFRFAGTLEPRNFQVHNNFALLLSRRRRFAEAARAWRRAVALEPAFVEAFVNFAAMLTEGGEIRAAARLSGIAERLSPRREEGNANQLLYALYLGLDPEDLARRHRDWAVQWAEPLAPAVPPVLDWDGRRRLRVGYVSADFWWHPVSYFFEPLLEAHDRGRFEIFLYAAGTRSDALTERLKAKADHWLRVGGLTDAEMAARIRRDGIDILVDLGGHTGGNRLLAFARRPAPVQVSWLGYPHSTGMTGIDYRFSDRITEPAPQADRWSSERIVRLPGGFHCYRAPCDIAPAAEPPLTGAGHVTFGSFNNLAKINDQVVACWAAILSACPGSVLLLKARLLEDPAVSGRLNGVFASHGIGAERIVALPYEPDQARHLELYGRVDIALDTFPYNGTTTTCEALWMGVPVIGLLGRGHAGRVGASLLSQVGLDWLVGRDEADYVRRAVTLAADTPALAELRRGLRRRMRDSTLCDAAFLARKIEAAYLEMAFAAPRRLGETV
ncbi:MAG: tetratricopeptide repeat protein [Caulobacter sp.]|nr:tetratricopeptide repeat protein [Caulobacter sp.]